MGLYRLVHLGRFATGWFILADFPAENEGLSRRRPVPDFVAAPSRPLHILGSASIAGAMVSPGVDAKPYKTCNFVGFGHKFRYNSRVFPVRH